MKEKQNLIGPLAYWVAAGKLDARAVLPVIQKLSEDSPKAFPALLETLEGEADESLVALAHYLRKTLRKDALRIHETKRQGLPVAGERESLGGLNLDATDAWSCGGDASALVETAIRMSRELAFLAANQDQAPRWFLEVQRQSSKALADACAAVTALIERLPELWLERLAGAWGDDLPGRESVLPQLERRQALFRDGWLEQAGRFLKHLPAPNELASVPETLASRFAAAESRDEKAGVLDLACSWMTPAAAAALQTMTGEVWARDRACWNLTVRFGQPDLDSWERWQAWLARQAGLWESEQESLAELIQHHAPDLALVLYSQVADPDPAALDALVRRVTDAGQPVKLAELLTAWAKWAPFHERQALMGLRPPPPPVPAPPAVAAPAPAVGERATLQPPPLPRLESKPAAAQARTLPVPPALIATAPPVPPKPSAWELHIQPFFVENWYIVAGIAMVILGSSLLAYYTWDKHWLVRYTIMPLLLGGFTWSLARVGDWMEKRSAEFTGTAAILRGAAIGLLPINFMATALLSADETVPQKGPALLAMALLYLSVFGWGLRKWCAAVEPRLGTLLGGALLWLNALVVIGPLARTVGHLEGQALLFCLGAGFYAGFAATAGAIVYFTRKILTRRMAEEKRVPWFVAGALAITFLEVFVWVHGFMRHLPQAPTYALMVILTGWLILHSERRALQLKESTQLHGGESFLGFGMILLGLLMGFSEPTVRMVSFLTAGAVWMYQGLWRRHPLHDWIALTLLGLGGAAVGLLPHYPGPWLPLLGVMLALGFGLGGWLCGQGSGGSGARGSADATPLPSPENAELELRAPALAQACRGMQMVALVLTAVVAPLVQWHFNSAPPGTAGWLALVAGLFGWRALRERQVHWLHAAMAILALALPYAGFMDVAGRSPHDNTMVFGLALLSWLWLGANWLAPGTLLQEARSTVLWLYGILALAAMLLRVVLGDTAPEPLWYRDYMDYGGPLLMMLALAPATYFSRSLAPAGMAVAIMAILFPELKANLQQTTPWLSWGTGLGSSLWGLALIGLCFALRPWAFLKALPEGDRLMGRERFPFQRHDHTLFTWPIMAAAVYLLIKVDTWHLARNFGGMRFKTALALGITGVAWTFAAVYHRRHRAAVTGVHLGWLCLLAGVVFGYWQQAEFPRWTGPALAMGWLMQGLYWGYRFGLEPARPWVRELLTEPTRMVLLFGAGLLAIVGIADLINGAAVEWMLYGFLIAQLLWHARRTRQPIWGTILFFQLWIGLLAVTAPGSGPLWLRISVERSLSPTLGMLSGIQFLLLAMELARARRATPRDGPAPQPAQPAEGTGSSPGAQLSEPALAEDAGAVKPGVGAVWPLLSPLFVLATGLTALLGLGGLLDAVQGPSLSGLQQFLLLGTLLLTARAQASNVLLLPAVLLTYLMLHREALAALNTLEGRLEFLATPWRLGLLGLGLALVAPAGRWVYQRQPRILAGALAVPAFTAPSRAWLFWPAILLSGSGALYQTLDPALRESGAQLWAPYLATLTFALVAWFWRQAGWYAGAGSWLLVANIHLVRVLGGEFLRGHGLSELHLICVGVGITLVQASALRRLIHAATAVSIINRASLGLAGFILALLSANYFTAPNLETITYTRFIVSGALAWLAGWYFRRAARQPGPGEEAHSDLCEALYHFGLVVAFWCAALLAPGFRQPLFALAALGLPVAYFYAKAELGLRLGRAEARRYRNSAAALGFAVLGLYLFKAVFHVVLFPGLPVSTQHYHYNAPLILLLGMVLLRLHGLGGTSWLAFYGGLALMTGSYFLLTAWPGLSPFQNPMPGAWCALGLGHFWILLSYARSPLRTFIQRLARLDDSAWAAVRRSWGRCLLVATHGATLWGLVDYSSNTFMVAPLLAGAATIIIHQGILRGSPHYLIAAAFEGAVALHLDFLIPSYLPKPDIIWVILALWLALLAGFEFLPRKLRPETIGQIAARLGAFVLAHALYLRPWSAAGLWGLGLGALLAAWTPIRSDPSGRSASALERTFSALLLIVPAWLVYFSQARFAERGPAAALEPWPILATLLTVFLIGLAGRGFPVYGAGAYHAWARARSRLFDLTLGWLENAGDRLHLAAMGITTAGVGAMQILHYREAFAGREFSLLMLLEAALAAAWCFEGKRRQSMTAYYLMQLCAAGCFASIRRHLMLTTPWWNYEYDVWASLAFSFGLAGAKQALDLQPRALRVPLLTALCVLPVVALVWVVVHGLGLNLALMVVGLHSVLFAFLGKDNRESPYNILALAGFVGFILLTFYAKLQWRAAHAYIIPVGLGVLVLQELFKKRIPPEARNGIRLVTLMTMLGSSGYYALADTSHAITFNLTMIVLCLLAMGLGSGLRIRLYLALGFAGLMVDLASLLYKVLVLMERSARMTVVGSLVLLIGAILVFGAIYYKTNKDRIDDRVNRWRLKLAEWQ